MSKGLNKKMGDTHEGFLAALFGGSQSRGSGNQWTNPADGRTGRKMVRFAFAWDGKSTLGKSIGVSQAMWDKIREQAGGERPMLALRFYADEKLRVCRDLVVLDAHHLAELLAAVNEEPEPITWKFEIDSRAKTMLLNGHDITTCRWTVNFDQDLGHPPVVLINGCPPPYDTEIYVDGYVRVKTLGVL